jgi:hypothetical protein
MELFFTVFTIVPGYDFYLNEVHTDLQQKIHGELRVIVTEPEEQNRILVNSCSLAMVTNSTQRIIKPVNGHLFTLGA